jgi:penicillin-binding protein 1C
MLRDRPYLRRLLIGGAGLAALFFVCWFLFLFPRETLDAYPAASLLTDREGSALRMKLGPRDIDCRLHYRPEPSRDWICKAVVAVEDRRFWHHPGVDPFALARAIGQNLAGRRVISGASTLTTQVIRLIHPRRRTLWAKGVELFRALQLERLLGKQAILEQYLNRAPFGANLVGVESASHRYFGKEPGDLSLAEAALLAGMPQSPTRFRPDRFPDRARKRQGYVLDRMVALGMITPGQRAEASAQPIVLRRDAYPFKAPHFCELVLGSRESPRGETVIRTTLDPGLQRLAEDTLGRHAAVLRGEGVFGGAVVIIEVRTGAVRALVGSPDYGDASHAGQVNGAVCPRSAGSTLKPFAYALAMDQGRLTPETVLADIPRTFRDFVPSNFDGQFNGLVTARAALGRSLNIPALTLVEEIGEEEFLLLLRRLGLSSLDKPVSRYGLGLALGNGSVRLLDLANAYACLARGGEWRPYSVLEDRQAGDGIRLFSPQACWLMADMLSGDERVAMVAGHRAEVRLPRLAWKTGTSSGFRDAWVVGYNPETVVAVWVGNPDGRPVPALVGAKAAAPVMWDLVRAIYRDNGGPWFTQPGGVVTRRVCAVTGRPMGPNCSAAVEDWAIQGVSDARPCAVHQVKRSVDAVTGVERAVICEEWPPGVAAFLKSRPMPGSGLTLRLVNPVDGMVCKYMDGMMAGQRLALKAEGQGQAVLYWFVDNRLVGESAGGEAVYWPLERGRHVVVCGTADGRSARAGITVE